MISDMDLTGGESSHLMDPLVEGGTNVTTSIPPCREVHDDVLDVQAEEALGITIREVFCFPAGKKTSEAEAANRAYLTSLTDCGSMAFCLNHLHN